MPCKSSIRVASIAHLQGSGADRWECRRARPEKRLRRDRRVAGRHSFLPRRPSAPLANDRLAARVAAQLIGAGRIVWRELSLRARITTDAPSTNGTAAMTDTALWRVDSLDEPTVQALPRAASSWRVARPDVFSVRRTSVEDDLQPIVHEVGKSTASSYKP